MRKLKLSMATATIALISSPALAQGIPVSDTGSLLKQIEQIAQTAKIITNGIDQVKEAKRLFDNLNGISDVSSIAADLGKDALRDLGVSDSLIDLATGKANAEGVIGSKAKDFYKDYFEPVAPGGSQADSAYRQALAASGNRISTDMAVADATSEAAKARAEGLNTLQQRLGTASSSKEVADLQARIAIEQAQTMNDTNRIQAYQMTKKAQAEARAQNRAEATRSAFGRDADWFGGN